MRGALFVGLGLLGLLLLPVPTAMIGLGQQSEPQRQASHENNTLVAWGSEQSDNCWSHFGEEDADSGSHRLRELANGQLNVELRCAMQPSNMVFFQLDEESEYNVSILVRWNGAEVTENLNVSLQMSGQNQPEFRHEFENFPQDSAVSLRAAVPIMRTGWNGSNDNPTLLITMGIRGDRTSQFIFGQGTPAEFEIWWGPANTTIEFPILNGSVSDTQPEETGEEDMPGFATGALLASAAVAALWLAGRVPRRRD